MKFIGTISVAGLIGALPACSQAAERAEPGYASSSISSPSSPLTSTQPPVDCQTASQTEWMANCAKNSTTPQSSGPAARLGQPFDYFQEYANDPQPRAWKVTLTKAECGKKSIAKAEINPEWDGGDDKPEYIDAKPASGKDFCLLFWSWQNVGKIHANPDRSGDFMLGDERSSRSQEDELMSWTVMETMLGVRYADEVNPHESTKSVDVYQVPSGVTPDAVWFPQATLGGDSYILVSLS